MPYNKESGKSFQQKTNNFKSEEISPIISYRLALLNLAQYINNHLNS